MDAPPLSDVLGNTGPASHRVRFTASPGQAHRDWPLGAVLPKFSDRAAPPRAFLRECVHHSGGGMLTSAARDPSAASFGLTRLLVASLVARAAPTHGVFPMTAGHAPRYTGKPISLRRRR